MTTAIPQYALQELWNSQFGNVPSAAYIPDGSDNSLPDSCRLASTDSLSETGKIPYRKGLDQYATKINPSERRPNTNSSTAAKTTENAKSKPIVIASMKRKSALNLG
ncbi:MAG: hypothetical protein P4M13_00475 [Alphaproteobacteria bacterium]|nr:hypothetical protein [Alphaproteobacteria bacterium]